MAADGKELAAGGVVIAKLPAKWVAYSHTLFAYSAFFSALVVGCLTQYEKIVRNEYYGYPDEWFPSVSATTGDRYPARAIFQIFIALTSGPRFMLVFLWYLYITRKAQRTASTGFAKFLLFVGWVRTVSCGGWVYITSTDDHNTHDIAMILYLLCTLPWMLGTLSTSSNRERTSLRWRRWLCGAFFTSLVPMIYFFIQHKVHRVPGAYTHYAFFEWALILYDVAFDAVTALEFQSFELAVVDVSQSTRGLGASFRNVMEDNVSPSTVRLFSEARAFLVDSYLAFVFWSMLTSLALLIWYFPLWHMGISGYEAFLLVTISPVLLGIKQLRYLIRKHRGVFHLLSLVGVASYMVKDPAGRLATTALGIALSLLTWTGLWVEDRDKAGKLEREVLVWGLGLLAHCLIKFGWQTLNPIWPIMDRSNGGWNDAGLMLGVVCCIELLLRDASTNRSEKLFDRSSQPISKPAVSESWFQAACGFGAVLFVLHSMYTDSSTIMRWTVDGYPNYGPSPVPWGVVTILALGIGMLLSGNRSLALSWAWFGVGSAACAVFYFSSAWTAYYAGLILGAYFMSITPHIIRSVVGHPPGKTLFTAMMIYNVLCLAHVWVVAYEFVPGGVYARERTNWILASIMLLTAAGINTAAKASIHYKATQLNLIKSARAFTRFGIFIIIIFSALVAILRGTNAKAPVPHFPEHKAFTAGIWTIHFGLDDNMLASEKRMRDVIRDLRLDVVGVLESDTMRIIMGNRETAQFIAEDLGYYIDYGPSSMKHTWGCLMLSKFPIIKSTHHLLPSPVGELACAIHATLDVFGQPVDFIVSHNGQEENPLDREMQTTELARIMRESPNPFVFLGYVVTKPFGPLYHTLFDDGKMNDIDPTDDFDRWCEYIGYRGLNRIGYARVSHGDITDTEIQTGLFQVVDRPQDWWKAQHERIDESQVPAQIRYPDMFKGQGVRGHRYHVFDAPKYFKPEPPKTNQ
ncbi:hypothetical protein BZG36_01851 [Bifiguratus adelaidae]|uniref:Calcofluor white hypersensitive protein n=1 Tax=Bifiguratus adelaidae TaxID=1938954 RepID=A0A261Y2G4_9FUNG|nr:hypothetical protein BZG36_01851 [Bifiguratus adelaidae]